MQNTHIFLPDGLFYLIFRVLKILLDAGIAYFISFIWMCKEICNRASMALVCGKIIETFHSQEAFRHDLQLL